MSLKTITTLSHTHVMTINLALDQRTYEETKIKMYQLRLDTDLTLQCIRTLNDKTIGLLLQCIDAFQKDLAATRELECLYRKKSAMQHWDCISLSLRLRFKTYRDLTKDVCDKVRQLKTQTNITTHCQPRQSVFDRGQEQNACNSVSNTTTTPHVQTPSLGAHPTPSIQGPDELSLCAL